MEISRGKPILKNRVEPATETAAGLAIEQPTWGQARVSNELRQRGLSVLPFRARCVWQRHDLENMEKRLKALEARMARDGAVLTEAQAAALEKAKQDNEAHGEFESECPGCRVAQDTFHVGALKGVGRACQRTVIDTYSKGGFAKPYDAKTPIIAAEMPNDRVAPFFEEQGIVASRMLTDRGTECCGTPQSHEHGLHLAAENIDHTRTKARSPQANGICERFNKTLLTEFHQVALRKKIYRTIEELQADPDVWMRDYNTARTHQGRWRHGKTSMQTFADTLPAAKGKLPQAA